VNVRNLVEITRKENFIYYRREFHARAVYELPEGEKTGKIEFTIETEPTGKKDISVRILDPVDYPLLPVLSALKEAIRLADYEGSLP